MNPTRFAFPILASFLLASPCLGAWGVLDNVPGATVILPFFEVGIVPQQNPHDTLPVIYNRGLGQAIVHWEAYNIDAVPVFSGTESIPQGGSWSFSIRSLIDTHANPNDRAALSEGAFYQGFMTIDLVTVGTFLPPFAASYPFRDSNSLLGYAYYLRLAEGSANGLSLPSLEYTASNGVPARLNGFYGPHDAIEEMDINARLCSQALTESASCNGVEDNTATIRSRVFQSNAINGETRVVVFTWNTQRPEAGGPSAICDSVGTCNSNYVYQRRREDGTLADSGTLRLDHVVNVIDTSTGPVAPGEHLIFGVEDPDGALQLFAFSFNSAQPAGNPNTNWDAIFESSIVTD